jgi:hypothetical protein
MSSAYAGTSIFVTAAAVYLLPSAIALLWRRRSEHLILALNVLLGWTLIGWVAAFIWACSPKRDRRRLNKRRKAAPQPSFVAEPAPAHWDRAERDVYADWLERGGALDGAALNKVQDTTKASGGQDETDRSKLAA